MCISCYSFITETICCIPKGVIIVSPRLFECFCMFFSPTGAILGFLLGVFQMPVNECDDLYQKLGADIFKQNVIVGTVKMGWSHAFYDSEAWENMLK